MRFSLSTHLLIFSIIKLSIIRTGWPILVELIHLANSVIIFLSQTTLLRWLTFLLLTSTLDSPALLDLLISSDVGICSTIVLPLLRNSDHVLVSISSDFPPNSKQGATFHCTAYKYSYTDWDTLQPMVICCSRLRLRVGCFIFFKFTHVPLMDVSDGCSLKLN